MEQAIGEAASAIYPAPARRLSLMLRFAPPLTESILVKT